VSKLKLVLEAIRDKLIDDWNWDTEPTAAWYPDLERKALQTGGITAIVLPVNAPIDPQSRGGSGPDQQLQVHVAVIAPIVTGDLGEGDEVVGQADDIGRALVHTVLDLTGGGKVAIVDGTLEPAMVADTARQQNLWVSYLKLEVQIDG
jgi:hypothetical protein